MLRCIAPVRSVEHSAVLHAQIIASGTQVEAFRNEQPAESRCAVRIPAAAAPQVKISSFAASSRYSAGSNALMMCVAPR